MRTIDIDDLRRNLSYDPDTGVIMWIDSPRRGLRAGYEHTRGYRCIRYQKIRTPEHRIAWALFYGEWPEYHIDHINGDHADNRIANLRVATWSQNSMNKPVQSNNKSGYKGVHREKSTGKWVANINVAGTRYRLGRFNTAEEAYAKYCEAAPKIHGEFANLGRHKSDALLAAASNGEKK